MLTDGKPAGDVTMRALVLRPEFGTQGSRPEYVRLGYRSRDRKSRLSRINDARRRRSSIASVVKPP
jgi:hypothetical protein